MTGPFRGSGASFPQTTPPPECAGRSSPGSLNKGRGVTPFRSAPLGLEEGTGRKDVPRFLPEITLLGDQRHLEDPWSQQPRTINWNLSGITHF